ncbi:MAG: hypothetical protein Q8R92_04265 [Deltaproteobacteria bacterium]|nr:hypothetical protein [Deltaproteobacteria bacterium]
MLQTGTHLSFSVGGIVIEIEDPARTWEFSGKDPHRAFLVERRETPNIALRVQRGARAPRLPGKPIYSTDGGLWNLHHDNGGIAVSLGAPAEGGALHRVARMDGAFTRGEVLVTPAGDRPAFHPYPLRYPLDEVIVINHLARGRGAIFHAAGLITPRGEGWLFLGRSGAGKSTMSGLWAGREGCAIISDDRIIVRPEDRHGETGCRMYGTPWHGDAEVSSPKSAPLARIFLLEQAPENRLVTATPGDAARSMLVNCFAPFYDAAGMEWTLGFVNEIVGQVPVHTLRFLPEASLVDHLLNEGVTA